MAFIPDDYLEQYKNSIDRTIESVYRPIRRGGAPHEVTWQGQNRWDVRPPDKSWRLTFITEWGVYELPSHDRELPPMMTIRIPNRPLFPTDPWDNPDEMVNVSMMTHTCICDRYVGTVYIQRGLQPQRSDTL